MAIQTLQTLKSWFVRGAKPTQQQFGDAFDSFVHKSDMIPQSKIEELSNTLEQIQETTESAIADAIEDVKVNGVSLEKTEKSVNVIVTPSDLAQNSDDCIRLNILKVLDIGTVGNKVVIDVPEGYVCYAQTAETAGVLKYSSWVNGYNQYFQSYGATLKSTLTAYGLWNTDGELSHYEESGNAMSNVTMSSSGTIPLPQPKAYAVKGGTSIEIEVTATTIPDPTTVYEGVAIQPKILIWGTLFCYRRTME